LTELDLYDNLISHLKGLDDFNGLTSLDLSFNKLKHIKNISHLVKLKDLYFVQNKISKIEGVEGLTELRNLELGANRIRVSREMLRGGGLSDWFLGNREPRDPPSSGGALAWKEQNHRDEESRRAAEPQDPLYPIKSTHNS
jgi:hypothetical protein